MRIKLIKALNIKYSLIPELLRSARRLLQKGYVVDVLEDTADFLIDEGFAVEDKPVVKKKSKKKTKSSFDDFNYNYDESNDESYNEEA